MTPVTLDVDPCGADSRRAQAEIVGGPLAAGFEMAELPLAADAAELAALADTTSMLVRLKQDLGPRRLEVAATLTDDDGDGAVPLVFETFSAAGSALLLRARAPAAGDRVAVRLALTLDGAAVDAADVGAWVALDLMRGHLAHVLTLLALEHQRLRRYLAAIEAGASIAGAWGGLLDRIGAELGVPRLDSRFQFTGGTLTGIVPERETDAAYRARLAPFRAYAFPTPGALRAALRTVHPDFDVEERTMGFEGAYRLVAFADTDAQAAQMRADALAHLRATVLVDAADATPAPAGADAATRARVALRERLRQAFVVPGGGPLPLAPVLARALARLAELFERVAYAGPVRLVQGQTDEGGARYELGLGARLEVPATFVDDFGAALAGADALTLGVYARAVEALQARPAAERGQLDTLLSAVGFSTALALDDTHVYVSHLRTGAMEIAGAGAVALGPQRSAATTLKAEELVPATAVALDQALSEAAATAGVAGAPLAGAAVVPLLGGLPAHDAAYRDLVLTPRFSLADQAAFGTALGGADPGRLSGLQVEAATAARLVQGDGASWDALLHLSFALADLGVPAMAVVVRPGGDVVVVASDAPLPALGANLTLRRTLARRWGQADLTQGRASAFGHAGGAECRVSATAPGLRCVALMNYRRLDQPDPMEIRPALPADTEIDYPRYERMMNLLMLLRPLGVAVNSWRIRQRHVRLDPQAPRAAVQLSAARSFRRFRQIRFARAIARTVAGDSHG